MKVIIFAALFVAAVSGKAAPISHSFEVSSTGEVGNTVNSPLVSLLLNLSNGLSHLVSIEGLPAQAPAIAAPAPVPAPEAPISVVDTPAAPETPIVVAPENPGVVVVPGFEIESPVVVSPESPISVVDTPTAPEAPVVVAPENPGVVIVPGFEIETPVVVSPENPGVVIVPGFEIETPVVVSPESPISVVDTPTAPETPIVVAPETPGVVVVPGFEIETPVVVSPEFPISVVDTPAAPEAPVAAVGPEEAEAATGGITNNFLINVLLNFIMGKDGATVMGSGLTDLSNLPQGLQQLLGGPTPRV